MKLKEITDKIEKEFPKEDAYEWDNAGLLAGSCNAEVNTVYLTLDITPQAVREAADAGADLIISHHPILFDGIKRITDDTADGEILQLAIANNTNLYAAHTNCDRGVNGTNTYLARLFELSEVEDLCEDRLGKIGTLKNPMTLAGFSEEVKKKLKTPCVRVVGELTKTVKCVAIGSGACGEFVGDAQEKNADVMITGDTKYHQMLTAENSGMCVIDAGHYPTEVIVKEIFEEILKDCPIKIVKSKIEDVYKYI